MNQDPTPPRKIPLPKDPRHQRFGDGLLEGINATDAYLAAGYKVSRDIARKNATRLAKSPQVKAYTEAVRAAAATDAVLSLEEKRLFCASIVRTPITALRPDDPSDPKNVLIKKWVRRYSTEGSGEDAREYCTETLEKLCPLKAIDLDNKLSGDSPDDNFVSQFASALAAFGKTVPTIPGPDDRM